MRPPGQPELFADLVETVVTRDEPFDDEHGGWGTRRVPPSGKGWRIDRDRERATRWVRRTGVPWVRSPSITPGRRR